jgi:hypothetical protein
MSNESRHKVAQAWRAGHSASGANVFTDGSRVYSYGHRVGYTADDGTLVAYDCHYSQTTAKHCSAFKAVAGRVEPCRSCDK